MCGLFLTILCREIGVKISCEKIVIYLLIKLFFKKIVEV